MSDLQEVEVGGRGSCGSCSASALLWMVSQDNPNEPNKDFYNTDGMHLEELEEIQKLFDEAKNKLSTGIRYKFPNKETEDSIDRVSLFSALVCVKVKRLIEEIEEGTAVDQNKKKLKAIVTALNREAASFGLTNLTSNQLDRNDFNITEWLQENKEQLQNNVKTYFIDNPVKYKSPSDVLTIASVFCSDVQFSSIEYYNDSGNTLPYSIKDGESGWSVETPLNVPKREIASIAKQNEYTVTMRPTFFNFAFSNHIRPVFNKTQREKLPEMKSDIARKVREINETAIRQRLEYTEAKNLDTTDKQDFVMQEMRREIKFPEQEIGTTIETLTDELKNIQQNEMMSDDEKKINIAQISLQISILNVKENMNNENLSEEAKKMLLSDMMMSVNTLRVIKKNVKEGNKKPIEAVVKTAIKEAAEYNAKLNKSDSIQSRSEIQNVI